MLISLIFIFLMSLGFTEGYPFIEAQAWAGTTSISSSSEGTLQNELEDVVVLAPKIRGSLSSLLEERRQSSAITEALGSEQMSRQGDSDVANSLRRVTGLTLMNGKYVYVRGLGERYSSISLNNFNLSSPEPSRRVVPLDLFPTAVLDSVIVQKSYSPDLPGDFGGGQIQLQTRSFPETFFFKSSFSTVFENSDHRLTYRGGQSDWMGVDDGGRQMPRALQATLQSGKKLVLKQPGSSEGLSQEELDRLGRQLSNNYATQRTSQEALPNLTVSTGRQFQKGSWVLGVTGSALYGQSADQGEKVSRGLNALSPEKLTEDFSKTSEFSEVNTRVAGHLNLGLQIKKYHTLDWSSLLLRHTTNLTQSEIKKDPNSISQIESTTLNWTERQLWTQHLQGRHHLQELLGQPIEVSWRAGWSKSQRDQPDRREYAFERTPSSYRMRSDSGGNRRTYSDLEDQARELGLDIEWFWKEKLKFKFGLHHMDRERRSDVFRLFFSGPTTGAPIEEQLDPRHIGPGEFQLRNLTDAADSYSGQQYLSSQYAMVEIFPSQTLSLQLGMRHESSVQKVKTFRYFEPDRPFSRSQLNMEDRLPVYSIVWRPYEHWRARWSYSETVARPDFRELSEVGFLDDVTGYEIRGNSALKGTVLHNLDHRWEYDFSSDEYMSLGVFYKKFENPMEVLFVPGVNRIQTFVNARAAHNYGMEFETRLGFRHLTRAWRRWSFLSNITLIRSRVELEGSGVGVQTSDSRPLQGQSPYVINFQLQYERPQMHLMATLLYSVVGPRITEVGTHSIPDTYERPVNQIDFVASKSINSTWNVALRVKNLLDPPVESYQGSELVYKTHYGRTYGVSLHAVY